MKKLKAVIRKLLGITANHYSPVTVDICSNTKDGFVLIGWYYKDRVDLLSIVDDSGKAENAQIALVTRDDVLTQTNNLGQGFELLCSTQKNINDLFLTASKDDVVIHKKVLSVTQSGYATNLFNEQEFQGLSTESIAARAACDSLIYTENYIMLNGWFDGEINIKNVFLKAEGLETRINPLGYLRYIRKDVQNINNALSKSIKDYSGFIFLFEVKNKNLQNDLDIALTIDRNDKIIKVPILSQYSQENPLKAIRQVLKSWVPYQTDHLQHYKLFIPIVGELYPKNRKTEVNQKFYGSQKANYKVSIIIPLFGRFDFIKFQLSHFSRYKEYNDAEIIYVVDDPNIREKVDALASQVTCIFRHPFSVLYLADNTGFGTANNIGVNYAKAQTVVLLNSDVLPKGPTWLEKMYSLSKLEDTGIIGARLLYEDEKIQHDGMAPMTLRDYPGYLFNDHPNKGKPSSDIKVQSAVEPCILITAACWMLEKTLFEKVGGFDPIYTLGDFEDSDLCLKLHQLGKINYIHHDAELYHLERQSQNLVESGGWKHNLTILNAIKFNQIWREQLNDLYPEVTHYE